MSSKAPKNAQATEQLIRETAIRLISKVGYESMSLRQLAAEAGVNPGTLYLYYQGKKELLASLMLDYMDELLQSWRHACPRGVGADVELRAFVDFHVRHHLLRKEEGVLGNMELRSLDSDDLEAVKQARRTYLREIQDILERGIAQGRFHSDEPKLLSHVLFNMLTHVCSWYRPEGSMGIDEVVEHYSMLVLRLTGATPADATAP